MKFGTGLWFPASGLILLGAGLAYLIACKFRPKNFQPRVQPLPLIRNLNRADMCAGTLDATQVKAAVLYGKCGACGLEHGSDAARDGNKQACIDALLAKMPKRGEHGRFAKRP